MNQGARKACHGESVHWRTGKKAGNFRLTISDLRFERIVQRGKAVSKAGDWVNRPYLPSSDPPEDGFAVANV